VKAELLMSFVALALAAPILTTSAVAGDAPAGHSQSQLAANTNQCDPACVAPEICCRLSGTESACVDPKDCFASDDNSKLKRK